MAIYSFDQNTGVVSPDTSDVLAEVTAEWKTAFGEDLVTTPDTPQGVLITQEALSRSQVAENNAQIANQFNPNTSGGIFLDALCAMIGEIERRPAMPSVIVDASIGGVAGTLIPSGSLARSQDGNLWATNYDVTLGSDGTALVRFVCTVTGPIACLPGDLFEPLTSILGWESVTNSNAAVLGVTEQSDAELQYLRRATLARKGISTRNAQQSNLNAIPDVTSSTFLENTSNITAIIDGVTMVPHSVWSCVDGGTNQEVAEALLRAKTAGAAWNGPVTVNVTDPNSGQVYPVKFQRPTYINPTIKVTVRQNGDPQNPATQIPINVAKWARGELPGDDGLKIGVSLNAFEISGAILYYNPRYFVTNVEISLGGVIQPVGIPAQIWNRVIIPESAVSVVLV
ncbi:MAG: baseplate J-like protein [Bacteriophage sp.]|nr:MAG: baseplate J-like protein [Bacteriophage sp.]